MMRYNRPHKMERFQRRNEHARQVPDQVEIWRDLRSQIEHEDGLVNQRLLWMLAFSGFLFAAYGYSLTAEATLLSGATGGINAAQSLLQQRISLLRMAICIAGLGVGFAAHLGTFAAFMAIKTIVAKTALKDFPVFYQFPIGNPKSSQLGMTAGYAFPTVTVAVWTFLLLIGLGSPEGFAFLGAFCTILICILIPVSFLRPADSP